MMEAPATLTPPPSVYGAGTGKWSRLLRLRPAEVAPSGAASAAISSLSPERDRGTVGQPQQRLLRTIWRHTGTTLEFTIKLISALNL